MPLNESSADASVGSLANRLRGMARGRSNIDVAQFQLVDLNCVERAYGDRWPAEKERVLDVAWAFLQKRVSESDVLIKGGSGFLLVFDNATGPEAELAALGLRHALNEFFLGKLDEHVGAHVSVTCQSLAVTQLVAGLQVGKVASTISKQGSKPLEGPTEWLFQPVWNVPKEALAASYVVPYDRTAKTRLPGYQFEAAPGCPGRFAAIDAESLVVSEQALRDLLQAGGQALVGVSIHISSLLRLETRRALLAIIDRFEQRLLRYRTLKIAGVVPGLPRIYLDEVMKSLRARIPNIVLGAAWDEPDLQGLLASQPVAVGFALPHSVVGPTSKVGEAALVQRIRKAVEIAHAAKRSFFVEGQIPRYLAVKLAETGVDNISSPLIWPARPAIAAMAKWPADLLTAHA